MNEVKNSVIVLRIEQRTKWVIGDYISVTIYHKIGY